MSSSPPQGPVRRGRPTSPLLNENAIIETAWRLVREGQPFSVGRIARELDVHVSSLYNHVGSREELVNHLRDRIVAAYPTHGLDRMGWQDAIRAVAATHHKVFTDHPGLIQLLAQVPIDSERVLATYTQLAHKLMTSDFSPTRASQVIDLVDALTLGSALTRSGARQSWPEDLPGGAELTAESTRWESESARVDASFTASVETLIRGLERELST
ncbi:TetR/AcrR family transcriptional regulator C-terminal domain-containing protein [Streptomyces sp. NPDC097619]|uniref:TetR/AcrR family transcriptional regulator n=1 Tax=Streptomyces sp. NPDC097619 TaxID=3157228 RepID=UPI003330A86B